MLAAWILVAMIVLFWVTHAWATAGEEIAEANDEKEKGEEPLPDTWGTRLSLIALAVGGGVVALLIEALLAYP
ncbi:MAG: hypothetical protein AB7V62_10690 [Thermoleophilia bacterium]